MRFSINDQRYLYAKYNENSSTRACFLKFLVEQYITHGKSVVRCVYNHYFFIINNGTFLD